MRRESSAIQKRSRQVVVILALLYMLGAALAATEVIVHAQKSTNAIEQVLIHYDLQNEGAESLDRFTHEHPFLGFLLSSPIKHELKLPSHEHAEEALGPEIRHLLMTVRQEASITAWWSWYLLILSFFYLTSVLNSIRSFTGRPFLFALTAVSVICFVIGIFAPAMVIWTAPSIPMGSGQLEFVLQHQVRGIAAIIWELLTTGHWVIGGFLLLFSILTPLTKASLTFFVTASHSKALNFRIGQFLHAIGKWSMADVFVAGVILALYALKTQEATKSIPCLGLYYFIGYCMLSMTTTQLLVSSAIVDKNKPESNAKLGNGMIGIVLAAFLCFVVMSGIYTYQQYTLNTKEHVKALNSPKKLDNASLVLPLHK